MGYFDAISKPKGQLEKMELFINKPIEIVKCDGIEMEVLRVRRHFADGEVEENA